MNALSIERLTKEYPSFILDDVTFSVEAGRITGLIGRNGAGKTTLIKGVLRLISTSGTVKIFGKDIAMSEAECKQEIGYVGGGFEYYALKKLSVIRKAYSRFYPKWDTQKYEKLLKSFSLDENKKVRELSAGMKVKFFLALALSHGARLLIMDEPTSGLDPISRDELCDTILNITHTEEVTVLFSTHITSDLMRIADDIVYISGGRLLADAPINEFIDKYRLIKFRNLNEVDTRGLIGVKRMREGYEALVLTSDARFDGQAVIKPTIDDVMIHLEASTEVC